MQPLTAQGSRNMVTQMLCSRMFWQRSCITLFLQDEATLRATSKYGGCCIAVSDPRVETQAPEARGEYVVRSSPIAKLHGIQPLGDVSLPIRAGVLSRTTLLTATDPVWPDRKCFGIEKGRICTQSNQFFHQPGTRQQTTKMRPSPWNQLIQQGLSLSDNPKWSLKLDYIYMYYFKIPRWLPFLENLECWLERKAIRLFSTIKIDHVD